MHASQIPSPQNHLGSLAAPVYDREAMLREVLTAKLAAWLDGRKFFVNDLREMRTIARDIQGLGVVEWERVPPDLDRLHCMGFETLSPINLYESVVGSLEYVGLTEMTGADLLGAKGWTSVQQRVSNLKDLPGVAGSKVSSWAHLTLATLADEVFNGERFFNICAVDKLASALAATRRVCGLPDCVRDEATYAALHALHCKHWPEFHPTIRAGLKDAIWQVCGLDDVVGPLAFGEHWDRVKNLAVPVALQSPPTAAEASDIVGSQAADTVASDVDADEIELPIEGTHAGGRRGRFHWFGGFLRKLLP